MRPDEVVRFAEVGDACVDAQRNLLNQLQEAGLLDIGSVVGLHAMLDQVAATLHETHTLINAELLNGI